MRYFLRWQGQYLSLIHIFTGPKKHSVTVPAGFIRRHLMRFLTVNIRCCICSTAAPKMKSAGFNPVSYTHLVANDQAAVNNTVKMTLKMACPPGIKLIVKSVDGAVGVIQDPRAEKMRIFEMCIRDSRYPESTKRHIWQ